MLLKTLILAQKTVLAYNLYTVNQLRTVLEVISKVHFSVEKRSLIIKNKLNELFTPLQSLPLPLKNIIVVAKNGFLSRRGLEFWRAMLFFFDFSLCRIGNLTTRGTAVMLQSALFKGSAEVPTLLLSTHFEKLTPVRYNGGQLYNHAKQPPKAQITQLPK